MKFSRLLRIFSGLFALTVCTSYLHANTLSTSPSTINLLCTQGQPCASAVAGVSAYQVAATIQASTSTAAYTIAPITVPWLTVTGTGSAPFGSTSAITFTVVPFGWQTLPAGLNSTTVTLTSATATTLNIAVNLEVQYPPSVTVSGGTNVLNPVTYTMGATSVPLSLTVVSPTGLPIPFAVSAVSNNTPLGSSGTSVVGGTAPVGWLTINNTSGIAYSWGTTISFTASIQALSNAVQGDNLTANITITPTASYGVPPITLPLNISVTAGTATILTSGITPKLVPQYTSGTGNVTLLVNGTNFVSTTKVYYGATAAAINTLIPASNVTVVSTSYLQVSVPYTAAGPFQTSGNTFFLGVSNAVSPVTPFPASPSSAYSSISVTSLPIIYAITSASSYVEAPAGGRPNATPYDIISIFGANFCAACTGANAVQVAPLDTNLYRFPISISPDGTHKISVTFSKAAATPTSYTSAYLLFASNNQINVAVPGNVATLAGATTFLNQVNVQVSYDTALLNGSTMPTNSSAIYVMNYSAVDPGVFTIASNGQGQAAILTNSPLALNSQANPVYTGTGGTAAQQTAQLYLTGLGIPDASTSATGKNDPSALSTSTWVGSSNPFNCIFPLGAAATGTTTLTAATGYLGAVNSTLVDLPPSASVFGYVPPTTAWPVAGNSIDGAVFNPALLFPNVNVPCFASSDAGQDSTAAGPQITVFVTEVNGSGTPAVLTPGSGITYAGFVSGSVAGLYQINFTVPTGTDASTASASQAYVQVTLGGSTNSISSQPNTTMWIK